MTAPFDEEGGEAPGPPRRSGESRHAAVREAAAFTRAPAAAGEVMEGDGLYRLLVETVQDYAIFALDPDGHVLSWNEGVHRLKGYSREEIVGRHFSVFYPEARIAEGFPQYELESAARDGRFEDEGWRKRKDGTLFWANVIITALRDESGRLVGYAKVTRDLTERRRAEQALRESEERFRLLVESVRDYVIIMLDPDGRVASWNEGVHRLKGYSREEIVGRHFSVFYPEARIAEGFPQYELESAARDGRFEDEGWRKRKDGTLFWANVIITALRDESGRLVGYAKVTRDLTERRASEQRAIADARRVAAVEASSRAKSEFLTAMSHELRTPLNAIAGYAALMEMGVGGTPPELHRDYLSRIRTSQQHLLAIVTDLLNYGRVEAGQVTYDLVEVPVHALVDAVFAMVAPQAAAKSLTLAHGPCSPDATARADRLKVEQIMLNLLSNAVKFAPEGGRVTVACASADDRVHVAVHDTGAGVPVDKREAIFEPFVQLGRTLASAHEGTGLGLSISRELARAMGGDVTVEDSPEGGAAFTLILPSTGG